MSNDSINWKKIWKKKKYLKINFNNLLNLNGFVDHAFITESSYKKFILKLTNILKINKLSKIFEFGCGSGLNLLLLKKICKSVSGYDYSDNLIKVAQQLLKDKKNISSKKIFFKKKKNYDISIINSVLQYNSKKLQLHY